MNFSTILLLSILFCASCQNTTTNENKDTSSNQLEISKEIAHPEWVKDASIYEVNIRQYTPEGTFKAFEAHLPRLKELGVKILWIMPINPIGVEKRKGSLGSYYSIKDYKAINPEFGTLEDFKQLVKKAHELGFYVIVDWVANHTAWDNPWIKEHPDWYTLDRRGKMTAPIGTGWEDVADLDYTKPALWEAMTDALEYWVREADIDGYRCDVAGFVPLEFWKQARIKIEKIKPVFMLAEWESRDIHEAFNMSYAWRLWDLMHQVAKGQKVGSNLSYYFSEELNSLSSKNIRMNFIENHDKNAWEGTVNQNFGEGAEAMIVLISLAQGMPLYYSGQEAGLDRPLPFFEKDVIIWKEHPNKELIQKLLALKSSNKALWNAEWGGDMIPISISSTTNIIAFVREKEGDRVVFFINCSNTPEKIQLQDASVEGTYKDFLTKKEVELKSNNTYSLDAWKYWVLVQTK